MSVPADVGKQILDLKAAYESSKAQGASQSVLDGIHQQAENLRNQSGIKDSDTVYGNNNGVDSVRQNEMTQALIAARNQQPQVQAAQAPQQSSSNAQNYIDQLAAAKQQAQLAALGKSRDAALSNLNQEKSTIQPKYYDAKNQVAAGAQQSARNFAEYMAARGGTSAGSNAQATLMNNMSTQGNLGALGRQETQAYGDIGRRMTDVQNAYQSDIASSVAGNEADKMNALLNDYYQQKQMDLQLAQLMGQYNNQRTLAGQQFDQSVATDNRNYNYQTGRDNVLDNRYNQQFEYGKSQDAIKNNMSQQQIDNAAKEFAEQMGFNYANMNANDKQAWAQIAISQQNANNSASNAAWARDPKNPDNIYKQAQIDKLKDPSVAGGLNLDDFKSQINQNFYTEITDPITGQKSKKFDSAGARKYIIGLGKSDAETDQLLQLYGLPTN